MTSHSGALAAEPDEWPASDTVVLFDRPLNPAQPQAVSVFADDVWDLTPGLFEAHTNSCRLNFVTVPAGFQDAAKCYLWQLINHNPQKHQPGPGGRRLALRSIAQALARIAAFLHWVHARGVVRLTDVTLQDLDAYAADVAALETRAERRSGLLIEVRRFWSYRLLLPVSTRLPEAPPWDGELPSDLIGGARRSRENRTPRIAADTMQPLLMWSLRFVENFADDIIDAHHEYLRLRGRTEYARHRDRHGRADRMGPEKREAALLGWLNHLKQTGTGLPSRRGPDGRQDVDWAHLVRLFDLDYYWLQPGRRMRTLIEDADLPLGGPATVGHTRRACCTAGPGVPRRSATAKPHSWRGCCGPPPWW